MGEAAVVEGRDPDAGRQRLFPLQNSLVYNRSPEPRRIKNMLAERMAALLSGLFTGASIYINLVEHPARMQSGTQLALTEFAPSYHRATVMQVPLAVAGFLSSLVAWRSRSDARWLVGGG